MSVEWNTSLATGIEEIDAQHRELFHRFNALLLSCNQGKGKDEVLRLLHFLDDYVKVHFAAEEERQLRHGYPGYAAHRAQHQAFMRDVERLKTALTSEGATLSLVILTNTTLASWLVEHISRVDMEFADFLRAQGHAG